MTSPAWPDAPGPTFTPPGWCLAFPWCPYHHLLMRAYTRGILTSDPQTRSSATSSAKSLVLGPEVPETGPEGMRNRPGGYAGLVRRLWRDTGGARGTAPA